MLRRYIEATRIKNTRGQVRLIHFPVETQELQFTPFFFITIHNHWANCGKIDDIYSLHQHWHFSRQIAGFLLVPQGRTISL